MKATPKPIVLIILDGWGYREAPEFNAIFAANKPNWDSYWLHSPHALISGSGTDVGLPKGQMGNSEVGHLHMGAGRLVPQDLRRLEVAIETKDFFKNTALLNAIALAKQQHTAIHIIGLLSPGGVHSHENHIGALIKLAAEQNLSKIYVHAILDGRDTPPRSALDSIIRLEATMQHYRTGQIASLIGRYYAMDRDNRWERIQKAYDLYTLGKADYYAETAISGLQAAYERNESDEFVSPTQIYNASRLPTIIHDKDLVIFMNFRADRARQLSRSFRQIDFKHFPRQKLPNLTQFLTLTQYAPDLDAQTIYPPIKVDNTFGEYIAEHGLTQLRIAETEKYAHVTFFFNAGKEQPFVGEDRILIPSPRVATYDLKPEMSARELTSVLLQKIKDRNYDVIICNFANADMVGHSGNMSATIKAITVIDECLGKIIAALKEVGGEAIITADHGNAEVMFDSQTQQVHTAHTANLVPFLYIGRKAKISSQNGSLIDIAPSLLYLLNLPQPPEMAGKSLIKFE